MSKYEANEQRRNPDRRPDDVFYLFWGWQSDFSACLGAGCRLKQHYCHDGLFTYPWLATALLVILYLTIGPVFAVPRTGAVSFEIGIRPFLAAENLTLGQFIYTLFFFGATYYLAMTPNKLIDRVGKMLTPALLAFLVILFVKSFVTPLGEVLDATGAYITAPFSQGFQDGYQTMDLLASLSIGTIVVNAIRMRGTTDNKSVSKICIISGFITVGLMTLVYGSLAYIGATSAGVLGHVSFQGLSFNGGHPT